MDYESTNISNHLRQHKYRVRICSFSPEILLCGTGTSNELFNIVVNDLLFSTTESEIF